MITLTIPLQDIIIDPQDNPDLSALPEPEAIALLTQAYAFLDAPLTVCLDAETAVTEVELNSADPTNKYIVRLREKAAREASRGRYPRAVKLYDQILSQAPLLVEIRRCWSRKMFSGESYFVNEVHGTGEIYLEPTFGHFLLHRIEKSERALIVDKGLFFAGTSGLDISAAVQKNVSSALCWWERFVPNANKGSGDCCFFCTRRCRPVRLAS